MSRAGASTDGAPAPVAFTVLTGWLGAGKTTVLNRVLGAAGGRRIAVLVNELGRIAIDGRLILSRGGDVLELAGGCVCCKLDVKNDLWDGIADVVARSAPAHVILETTGIAEPQVILEGLARLPPALVSRLIPAGVVCVVDAEAGIDALARREEARAQVACADRVLLSKLDRAPAAAVAAIHARLSELGAPGERAGFPPGVAGDRALTEFVLERRAVRLAGGDGQRGHVHRHGQLTAVAFSDGAPLVGAALMALVEAWRPRLHRVKGFVHLAGDDRRHYLELAGASLTLTPGAPWGADPRQTELVVIGDDLDEPALTRQVWATRSVG